MYSHLCSHTFKHGLGESDACSCGQRETTEHFFFHCRNYAAVVNVRLLNIFSFIVATMPLLDRPRLISPGINYSLLLTIDKSHLLNNVLKGSTELSTEDNKTLFLAVQDSISNTCRFNHLLCNY